MNDDMRVSVRVQGTRDHNESNWAESIGMESYQYAVRRILNRWFTKMYNRVCKIHCIDNTMDEDSDYYKRYVKIANAIIAIIVWCKGGYNYRTRRKIVVNVDYLIKPEHDNYWYIDDMIFVRDF